MTVNEYEFAKTIVNFDKKINESIEYIKKNYNVDCEYDDETNKLNITIDNINEEENAIKANDYIHEVLGDYLITNFD